MHTLSQYQGKSFIPTTFAGLIGTAKHQAQTTRDNIFRLDENIKDRNSELKSSYRKCLERYKKAANRLEGANKSFTKNPKNTGFVKKFVSDAMSEAQSCNKELSRQENEPSNVAGDIGKLHDLGSIIVFLCDQISNGRISSDVN
ncbi:Unknown protein [Striga hermonthica]|uniref:Pectinesterase inhibitor domain-containing protein n=1 Tax=Striga hermonthica TaxID=68872 RepID=A0A9N7RNZ3_STRHE|nr:Unknown protein [Striga hermonthica]